MHLSGGVGLGGVLEPAGARPVIIEDGAFLGSRCIITEGVIVEREAVIGPGVALSSSVPVIDVTSTSSTHLAILREVFGYASFRGQQEGKTPHACYA